MAITLKVAGISYTLTTAQLRSLVHTTQANAPATLAGQIYQAAIPSASWAAGDAVELWVGGVRRFAGWLGPVETGCDAGSSYVQIQATDILGRLRSTTFYRYGAEIAGYTDSGAPVYSPGAVRQSALTLFSGQLAATDPVSEYYQYAYNSSSSAQIAEIVAFSALTFPGALALGTITGLSAANLPEKVTDIDCLSVLLKCLALRPDAVMWVDYSGATPLLHAAIRSALTPVTVSVAPGNAAVRAWSCRDRSDRLLEYLEWRLQYTYKEYTDPAAPDKGVITQPVELLYTYGDAGAPADKRHIRRFSLGAYAPVYTSGAAAAAQLGTPISQLPMSAAADYWAANSVLHYEGSVALYEPAGCTYAWSLGQTLSLTGAASAYESANALVRGCTYDLVSGQTSIDFGPPDQLGPGDLLNGASSLGSLTIGGITPRPTDTKTENPAQAAGDAPALADTLTQRIQDKLGSFAVLPGSGFQCATMDLNTEIHGFAEFVPSTPPRAYRTVSSYCSGNILKYSYGTPSDHPFIFTGATTLTIANDGTVTKTGKRSRTQDGATVSGWDAFTDHATAETVGFPTYDYNPPLHSESTATQASHISDQTTIIWLDSYHYQGRLPLGGPVTSTLSNEDTDADALARSKALASWSSWAAFTNTLNGGAATWQTVRTTGWTTTAHAAKIKGTIRSNLWGYTCRVSIPLYRYPVDGTKPSTPTSTQTWDLPLVDTLENTAAPGDPAVWVHVGVATLPEWEMPIEQGFVTVADAPTVSLP